MPDAVVAFKLQYVEHMAVPHSDRAGSTNGTAHDAVNGSSSASVAPPSAVKPAAAAAAVTPSPATAAAAGASPHVTRPSLKRKAEASESSAVR